ncbi:MAG TPA: sulfotransferase family 2 domain-containing protein [Candidatus Baltobacteraceae bacterium]|nr:sulfotransferase family 2 domain-containing protein [Candidatus Baltobacteraceae bacterium]
MPVSHALRCIFIHVPKAAGSSILSALRAYDDNLEFAGRGLWDILRDRNDAGPIVSHVRRMSSSTTLDGFAQTHFPAAALRELVNEHLWNQYLKFAFVRNPWDLVVSTYHYQRGRARQPQTRSVDPDVVAMLDRCDTFSDYVRLYPALRSDMSSMLADASDRLLVEFIGRYESLESDLSKVSERLGFTLALPHENRSEHEAYEDYYTPRTRAIVARHFSRDIDRFGYTFSKRMSSRPIFGD